MPLIESSNSVLVVIDVQDNFLDKLALHERSTLVSRIGWLMQVATVLAIPMIATAEDVSDEVDMCPSLKALLPSGQSIYNKLVFNLHGQDDIREALEQLGKRDVVLVGLETDICIAHSAIELLDVGYRVCVIEDATGSPWPHHLAGLRRMEQAGVTITNTKGIYYEWIRDVPSARDVETKIRDSRRDLLSLYQIFN